MRFARALSGCDSMDGCTNTEFLQYYYVRNGWAFVRDVNRPDRSSGALFQLPPQPQRARYAGSFGM